MPSGKRKVARIVAALEAQDGVRVRPLRGAGGWFLYLPGGVTATIHLSTSDHRALKNFRADIERAGLTWPGENGKTRS
jgi:hypothetical protein